MKKVMYFAFILLGVGILSSCDKIGGGSGSFVGTWDIIKCETYDPSGSLIQTETSSLGTFTFSDSALTINSRLFGDPPVYTTAYTYDKETKLLSMLSVQLKVKKHTSTELILEMNYKNNYQDVYTLKKR